MTELETAIAAQFQIGDRVVYMPENIVTRISGYVWRTSFGAPPSILTYELECGISVGAAHLCRAPFASGGIVVGRTVTGQSLAALREQTAQATRDSLRAVRER
jgi:hypothetical protein